MGKQKGKMTEEKVEKLLGNWQKTRKGDVKKDA